MMPTLPVLNLGDARYECTFGRGCDGVCCRNGRPVVYPEEKQRITASLERFLPHMRPEVRKEVLEEGIVSRRRRFGLPLMRVKGGWCVFFNQGCVLHKIGAAEGDKFRYKPSACSLFPLEQDKTGSWYVRQKGFKGEKWDLFCLDPENTNVPAAQTLGDELELAMRLEETAQL